MVGNLSGWNGIQGIYLWKCDCERRCCRCLFYEFDVWLKLRVLTADGTLLGETGLIRPGEYIKSVSLTSEVEDGTAIKLKIMAYEPDTYYSAGSVTLNTILRKGGAE